MIDKYSNRQRRIASLLKYTSGFIRVDDAMNALGLTRTQATRLLTNWNNQGIIRRISHGVYVPLNPSSLGQVQILEDPWMIVPELFNRAYIGGWSALEHWGLTEQVFRSVCVMTSKRTKKGDHLIQGVNFYLKHIQPKLIFGTKGIWRDHVKVEVSDPHKTILDIIDDPYLGAGLQHLLDSFKESVNIYEKDIANLFTYADIVNNGAIYKKLGYLSELLKLDSKWINRCKLGLTEGYANLGNSHKNRKLVTRWRLWIPDNWPHKW